MNTERFIAHFATQTKSTKTGIAEILKAFQEAIASGLKDDPDHVIKLVGFGTFTAKYVEEHQGRNPKNGEFVTIPASYRISFKPGRNLKVYVNEGPTAVKPRGVKPRKPGKKVAPVAKSTAKPVAKVTPVATPKPTVKPTLKKK